MRHHVSDVQGERISTAEGKATTEAPGPELSDLAEGSDRPVCRQDAKVEAYRLGDKKPVAWVMVVPVEITGRFAIY
jgi:hypothetical protein